MIQRMMSAIEFAEQRAELPDAGQWAELIRGVPVVLQPPDLDHGTIILNLSKALATYVQSQSQGYACFDLGLQVEHKPDTVFFPAICYFKTGLRFAEYDNDFTLNVPELVVELVTTSDRRQNINERTRLYIDRGTRAVWIVDSVNRHVHVVEKGNPAAKRVVESETLKGNPILDGFEIAVKNLFKDPDWVQ